MGLLEVVHGFAFRIPVIGHHLILVTAIVFLWSIVAAVRLTVRRDFEYALRFTWVVFALNALSGAVLGLTGKRVPSAVAASPDSNVTIVGYPPDPSRHGEHLMYGTLALLSLIAAEYLIRTGRGADAKRLRFLPLATLFLVAVCYRAVQVAYLPGSTPGT